MNGNEEQQAAAIGKEFPGWGARLVSDQPLRDKHPGVRRCGDG